MGLCGLNSRPSRSRVQSTSTRRRRALGGLGYGCGRHIHHRLSSAQQHRDQHQPQRAGQIDRPPHVLCDLVDTSNQLLNRALLVGDLLIPQHLCGLIDRTCTMAGFTDINSDLHLWPHHHLCSPVIAAQAPWITRHRFLSDDPHQLSISGRSVQRGGAAKSFGATTTAMKCQLHTPPPWVSLRARASGSERPHTAKSTSRSLGVHHPRSTRLNLADLWTLPLRRSRPRLSSTRTPAR